MASPEGIGSTQPVGSPWPTGLGAAAAHRLAGRHGVAGAHEIATAHGAAAARSRLVQRLVWVRHVRHARLWSRSGVDSGSIRGHHGGDLESIRGRSEATLGSILRRSGADLESIRCRLGSILGQFWVDLGPTCGRSGVDLGSKSATPKHSVGPPRWDRRRARGTRSRAHAKTQAEASVALKCVSTAGGREATKGRRFARRRYAHRITTKAAQAAFARARPRAPARRSLWPRLHTSRERARAS